MLSVLQIELMWIMFFIKLRIWAWFNSTEINGRLSIHLNEAESTLVTLECKPLHSFCLTEGICYFQKSLRMILPHYKLVKSGQEKRMYIHEGISIWKFLMSIANIYKLTLLYFSVFQVYLHTKWITFLNLSSKTSEGIDREVMCICGICAKNWSVAAFCILI